MDKTSVFYRCRRMPPSLSSLGSFSTSSVYFETSLLLYHTMLKGESVSSLLHLYFWYSQGSSLSPRSPAVMTVQLLILKKLNQRVCFRELGKKSGSEDMSVSRLQHNEMWTQSDLIMESSDYAGWKSRLSQLLPGLPVLRCSSKVCGWILVAPPSFCSLLWHVCIFIL